jgi:nucleoredoxin
MCCYISRHIGKSECRVRGLLESCLVSSYSTARTQINLIPLLRSCFLRCPPCRGFTPDLAAFYQLLQSKGVNFELVFVSSDKDLAQFNEYYGEMPWTALPFTDRERKGKLSAKFKVQGIPTLVVLDPEGNIITTNGRKAVSEDPTGENFPWYPSSFADDLGTEFIGKAGTVDKSAIQGKYLGLYFSAHW